jgi:hypothetical protein
MALILDIFATTVKSIPNQWKNLYETKNKIQVHSRDIGNIDYILDD